MAKSISLRAHFERLLAEKDLRDQQRFQAQETGVSAALASQKEAVAAALSAADRAVLKAEAAADKRFDSVNEFRNALADQTKDFPTKAVVDGRFDALTAQVSALTGRMDRREGSGSGQGHLVGYLVGVGGLCVAVLSVVMTVLKGHP